MCPVNTVASSAGISPGRSGGRKTHSWAKNSNALISISVYWYRLIGTKIGISVRVILLLILPIIQTVIKY